MSAPDLDLDELEREFGPRVSSPYRDLIMALLARLRAAEAERDDARAEAQEVRLHWREGMRDADTRLAKLRAAEVRGVQVQDQLRARAEAAEARVRSLEEALDLEERVTATADAENAALRAVAALPEAK